MKEYLLLLRAGKPAASKTDAENKAELQAWGAFMGDLGQKEFWLAACRWFQVGQWYQQTEQRLNL